MARVRTAVKFFTYGLVIGIVFAPRSGRETRSAAVGWVSRTVRDTLGM